MSNALTPQQAATLMLLDWQSERERRHAEFRRLDREYADTLDLVARTTSSDAPRAGSKAVAS